MALRDDVGQLFSIGFLGTSLPPEARALLKDARVGGAILFVRNLESVEQICALNGDIGRSAVDEGGNTPPLISVDQEGGRVQRLKGWATDVPSMRMVGNAVAAPGGGPHLAYKIGALLAREVGALGFGMNFAPVVDVDTNPANPIIGERSFSRDSSTVAALGAALVKGHQGAGVAACAKHFPGHGDTDLDSHLALPTLRHSEARLREVELPPFRAAVDAGVASIMTAHVVFEALDKGVPATLSKKVLRPLLREEMEFDGVIISDDLEMKAVADHYSIEDLVRLGLEAGVDHFLCCKDVERAAKAVEAANKLVENDARLAAQVAKSAARMRSLKKQFLGHWAPPDAAYAKTVLQSPAHLKLVEQIRAAQPVG